MYCFNCGQKLEDGSIFCMHCGTKLDDELDTSTSVDLPREAEKPVTLSKDIPEQSEIASVPVQALPNQMPPSMPQPQQPQMSAVQPQPIQTLPVSAQPPQPQQFQPHESQTQSTQDIDKLTLYRKIVDQNTEYYLPKFQNMLHGAKSQMNWASFFLGFAHAGYRNMWHEWLNAIKIPLIAEIAAGFITVIAVFSGSIGLFGLLSLITVGCSIWFLITQILFANNFNQHYMNHVENKTWRRDLSPDPSIPRAIIGVIVLAACLMGINWLSSALLLGGLFYL